MSTVLRAAPVVIREPAWSGIVTRPLAQLIPPGWRSPALSGIKGLHTVLFACIAAALVLALWDGLTGRPRRRTAIAGAIVLGEAAVYVSNNQVCPLTPLAEEFGADRGSVVDIFLPVSAARRIPLVAGSMAALALALNIRALVRRYASAGRTLTPRASAVPAAGDCTSSRSRRTTGASSATR